MLALHFRLVLALQVLHRANICHRDLKPSNILLTDELQQVRVADFGQSGEIGLESYRTGMEGTPVYMAPEMVLGANYNTKVDMWSFGCIIFEMATGSFVSMVSTVNSLTKKGTRSFVRHMENSKSYKR